MILKGYAHQVAGHKEEALLGINHRLIMKPMVKKDLFARESAFYKQSLQDKHDTNNPTRFIPKFLGILFCGNCSSENAKLLLDSVQPGKQVPLPHIVLEDLTYGYEEPNVIDIKMGTCTFEPTATQHKKDNEVRKYPFQAELGFRITGFKLLEHNSGTYLKAGKPFGRSVQPPEVTAALAMLFRRGPSSYRCDVIRAFIVQLENILGWLRSQTRYKFFCSSILLVYDAHSPASENNSVVPPIADCSTPKVPTNNKADYSSWPPLSAENNDPAVLQSIQAHLDAAPETPPLVRVKMIDFAHVVENKDDDNSDTDADTSRDSIGSGEGDQGRRPRGQQGKRASGLDEGYIHGLQSLIRHLHAVLHEVEVTGIGGVAPKELRVKSGNLESAPQVCLHQRVATLVQRVHDLSM